MFADHYAGLFMVEGERSKKAREDSMPQSMRATFRDEVHVVSPVLRPDGSRDAYTIPRSHTQYDCFTVNDGWEGY